MKINLDDSKKEFWKLNKFEKCILKKYGLDNHSDASSEKIHTIKIIRESSEHTIAEVEEIINRTINLNPHVHKFIISELAKLKIGDEKKCQTIV